MKLCEYNEEYLNALVNGQRLESQWQGLSWNSWCRILLTSNSSWKRCTGKKLMLGIYKTFFFNQKNSPINSVSHEFLKCSYIEESIGITYHLVSNKKLFLEILMISIYSTHETSYSLKQVLHNFLLKAKGVARKKYDSSPPSHCLFTCSFCAFGLLSSSRRVHG